MSTQFCNPFTSTNNCNGFNGFVGSNSFAGQSQWPVQQPSPWTSQWTGQGPTSNNTNCFGGPGFGGSGFNAGSLNSCGVNGWGSPVACAPTQFNSSFCGPMGFAGATPFCGTQPYGCLGNACPDFTGNGCCMTMNNTMCVWTPMGPVPVACTPYLNNCNAPSMGSSWGNTAQPSNWSNSYSTPWSTPWCNTAPTWANGSNTNWNSPNSNINGWGCSPFQGQFQNQCASQFVNPYMSPYTNQYTNQYASPFVNQTSTPFSNCAPNCFPTNRWPTDPQSTWTSGWNPATNAAPFPCPTPWGWSNTPVNTPWNCPTPMGYGFNPYQCFSPFQQPYQQTNCFPTSPFACSPFGGFGPQLVNPGFCGSPFVGGYPGTQFLGNPHGIGTNGIGANTSSNPTSTQGIPASFANTNKPFPGMPIGAPVTPQGINLGNDGMCCQPLGRNAA